MQDGAQPPAETDFNEVAQLRREVAELRQQLRGLPSSETSGQDQDQLKLEALFEASPVPLAVLRGRELIFEKINTAYHQRFQKVGLIGKPLVEVYPELKDQEIINVLRGVLETGKAFVAAETLVQLQTEPGGPLENRYFDLTYVRLMDARGRPYGIYTHSLDVTERVNAQRKLERSEDRFRELANAMPQIVWTARPDGYLDYYNDRWYQFSGFERGQGGDASWVPLLHPEDVEKTLEAWYESVGSGKPFKIELRFKDRTTGGYLWFLGQALPIFDEHGSVLRWYGSCTDIDQLKRAEQQVVDVLESVNDAFFSIGPDWRVSRMNSRMEVVTNCRRADVVGKNFWESFPAGPDSMYWVNHHRVMSERITVHYEEFYPPLDLWTAVSTYPTPDGGIAVFFRDISEQVHARQRLERLTDELRGAVRARDEFLSIASHELKTPVTSLKMQLQMTRRAVKPEQGLAPPPVKLARVLDLASGQVDRLTVLIEDLLDVSRIESGKMSYVFERVDLGELVSEVLERFNEQIIEARCSLTTAIAKGLQITCDRFRIEQVVTNLITNAIKYGAGSRLSVEVAADSQHAAIVVTDLGIGIDESMQTKIFDRFERAISHDNISGLGLGLYITKQIVDAHKGTIELKSARGQGSTFTIQLPKNLSDAESPK